ncbi:hypermethylated in cancer 2 protein isoform X1 [Hypanus sabinus]|uniref:hypermethylated in cancer 2 protein isoform X1 n=3 Tax=Hypanus sabinus TaxID=79690 RepID=UPI0028C4A98C|nr:hypermethylated in cancer 2 protein isoform X1 [Hypanus sabinus]
MSQGVLHSDKLRVDDKCGLVQTTRSKRKKILCVETQEILQMLEILSNTCKMLEELSRWLEFEESEVKMELPNHAKQLLLQLNQQRSKGFFCDVIIVVENALFRAHKNILAASSMYFKSLVLHDNLINLDTDMVNASIFRQILDFIYTGKLLLADQASEQNFNALLTAASYLQLHDLAALCRKKIKRNGKTLHGKLAGTNPVKLGRGHRFPSTPVIQTRFAGSPEGLKRQPGVELHRVEVSSEDIYMASSNKASAHPLGQNGGKSSNSNGANSSSNNCGEQEQMLGLDLSKKSPSIPAHMSQEDMHLGECSQGSPTSATNSASFEDNATNPHQAENSEQADRSELADGQGLADTGQPKGFRLPGHNAAWIKQETGFKRQEGSNCREDSSSVVNGVIMGPLVKSLEREPGRHHHHHHHHFDHAVHLKEEEEVEEEVEEEENGKECSEESAQSEEEGGQPSAHTYRPGPDGFEPAVYGDNLYVCIPCGKGFPSSEQLNAHVESHTEEDLYIKDEADSLATQSLTYAGDSRPYKCSVCEKSYRDPSTLRQHEKTHWLSRPFPCNICGKMFTQRGTMTRHMRSHLGLKPFACEECGMRFTRQYRLTEHMRVHSGEKPYECQVCGGKFTQQRNLISHMRMHTSPT